LKTTNEKLYVAYGDEYLDWRLGKEHPTNPERAQLAVSFLRERLSDNLEMVLPKIKKTDRESLLNVHDKSYVSDVLDKGVSYEWSGENPKLGRTALSMFAGTARLTELMLRGDARVAFNPQGAKHHAHYDSSSGFCVFNDMAWAAKEFAKSGLKPMYIDWDAHHGDGVEELLFDTDILTCSIHQAKWFPGTGTKSYPKNKAYNWALPADSGDREFAKSMLEIKALAEDYKPDVVLLATGADAHKTDPLSYLNFDYAGYAFASSVVSEIAINYAQGRVLIGGAGGYQPHTHTPMIWSQVVGDIYVSTRNLSYVSA
jgi:acetoin utilization protein AcuC